jgi:hypothetical protein
MIPLPGDSPFGILFIVGAALSLIGLIALTWALVFDQKFRRSLNQRAPTAEERRQSRREELRWETYEHCGGAEARALEANGIDPEQWIDKRLQIQYLEITEDEAWRWYNRRATHHEYVEPRTLQQGDVLADGDGVRSVVESVTPYPNIVAVRCNVEDHEEPETAWVDDDKLVRRLKGTAAFDFRQRILGLEATAISSESPDAVSMSSPVQAKDRELEDAETRDEEPEDLADWLARTTTPFEE